MSPIHLTRRQFQRGAASLAGSCALGAISSRAAHGAGKGGKIKIGQIGTAHSHAAGKLEAIRKLADDYELVGVVEADSQRRKRAEGRGPYQGLAWMSEEQLLATPGLEAVDVETPTLDLVPTAMRAVAAGKHVHLDKPPGISLASFHRLLDEAQRRRLTIQMGYMLRYNPAFQLCFEAVREGWLGEIFEVHAVMSKQLGAADRRRLLEYPGGSMLELGCHVIDAVVTVLGKPDRVTPHVRQTRTDLDDLADNQLAVFDYPQATATVRSSMVEVDGGARRQFVVCGTQGTFEIKPLEPPEATLSLAKACGPYRKGRQTLSLPKMTGRYDGEFADLAAVIRGQKALAWTPEHDLAVHETVLRASGLPLDS